MMSLLAFAACFLGAAWLALAMDAHWRQVHGPSPAVRDRVVLRTLGIAALAGGLMACLRANHPSIAALVWIMSVAVASLLTALLLAWRPRWLAWTVAWLR